MRQSTLTGHTATMEGKDNGCCVLTVAGVWLLYMGLILAFCAVIVMNCPMHASANQQQIDCSEKGES